MIEDRRDPIPGFQVEPFGHEGHSWESPRRPGPELHPGLESTGSRTRTGFHLHVASLYEPTPCRLTTDHFASKRVAAPESIAVAARETPSCKEDWSITQSAAAVLAST